MLVAFAYLMLLVAPVTAVSSRFFSKVPAHSGVNMCMEGKLLPQLFLLGGQKCATTSFAVDLMRMGVQTTAQGEGAKESHFFDRYVGQDGDYSAVTQRKAWLETLPSCKEGPVSLLADFTPSNLRSVPLPEGTKPTGSHWGAWFLWHDSNTAKGNEMDLPTRLVEIYGEEKAKDLTMVVMLREPLKRMQSTWYHASQPYANWAQCRDCKADSFVEALRKTMALAHGEPRVFEDWLWGSMYARQMKAWMGKLSPSQFYVIPISEYAHGDKGDICHDVSVRLHLELNCSLLFTGVDTTRDNTHDHPPIDEECPRDLRESFDNFIADENADLFQLLAEAHEKGAGLAGFKGRTGSVEDVKEWLEAKW